MKHVLVLLILAAQAMAIPQLINYQGQLTSPTGAPLDTTVAMTFGLYRTLSGGTASWTESHAAVTVTDGLFNVQLGSVTALPDSFAVNRWLGITVGNNTEMTPRQQVTSVAHAYRVGTVDGASGGKITSSVSIGSGHFNNGIESLVVGGNNTVAADRSTVAGGQNNGIESNLSFVGGGSGNFVEQDWSAVVGGADNSATGKMSFVGGGNANLASDSGAVVTGGSHNRARGRYSFIGGGGGPSAADSNAAAGTLSSVVGGRDNNAQGALSVISGGEHNSAIATTSVIGGGRYNTSEATFATISGGAFNTVGGSTAAIGGGSDNSSIGFASTIAGGFENTATDAYDAVGGGWTNDATGGNSVVAGGRGNTASGFHSSIIGGRDNIASGWYSVVLGGKGNLASGNVSCAGGYNAEAAHRGCFVWADSSSSSATTTTAPNQFYVRAAGGVRFYSNSAQTTGVSLAAGSGTWSALSDRNVKENFEAVDSRDILGKIATLDISRWNYKSQDDAIRHIGPMAQDFHAAFGVGESETTITTVDADGVALAAIQELAKQNSEKDKKIADLEARMKLMEAAILQFGNSVNGEAKQ